ncbi:MAG: hypothetical protein IJ021_09080 [Clostridia bacterium]|nr:hypothetical protein [Clostridia bacterium]
MNSEKNKNGEELDELEMFEGLDDSGVVLDTFTIEKKTRLTDFYHRNCVLSYALYAVFGRMAIFGLVEYGYIVFRAADAGEGYGYYYEEPFNICLAVLSFVAYAAGLILLARRNMSESFFRSTGHEFPVFKSALVYFLPGELIYLVLSAFPYSSFRFGFNTCWPLFRLYWSRYLRYGGRYDAVMHEYEYIAEDYIEFLKIFGIYELVCFAVFLAVWKFAYNRAFCRKARATAYNMAEYAAVFFAFGIVFTVLADNCRSVEIEADVMPFLALLSLALPLVYIYFRIKKNYFWIFSGYDSKENTAKKLFFLVLPGELLRAVLTFCIYGAYNFCRFGRVLAYPAYALYNAVCGGFKGENIAVFAWCYAAYVAVNFGVIYLLCKKAELQIFKRHKEKLQKL